jgi:hypothetical protein
MLRYIDLSLTFSISWIETHLQNDKSRKSLLDSTYFVTTVRLHVVCLGKTADDVHFLSFSSVFRFDEVLEHEKYEEIYYFFADVFLNSDTSFFPSFSDGAFEPRFVLVDLSLRETVFCVFYVCDYEVVGFTDFKYLRELYQGFD